MECEHATQTENIYINQSKEINASKHISDLKPKPLIPNNMESTQGKVWNRLS